MRGAIAVGVSALLFAAACGDAAVPKDAGAASSVSGAGGASGPSDAGGSGGTAAVGAMMDAGGTSGHGGSGAVPGTGGGGPTTPPPAGPSCRSNPELVPDAGDDACLACLLRRCCQPSDGSGCLLSGFGCYSSDSGGFAQFRACFARDIERDRGAADDAGSAWEPWYTAAACADEVQPPLVWPDDSGMVTRFPATGATFTGGPVPLIACAVGSRPESASLDEDGGVSHGERCAEECLEGWEPLGAGD